MAAAVGILPPVWGGCAASEQAAPPLRDRAASGLIALSKATARRLSRQGGTMRGAAEETADARRSSPGRSTP
jgi:hypothetical protein